MSVLHTVGLYGWYINICFANWITFVWAYLIANLTGLGILVGAHRLWTHRSFKAHWSIRIFLMILQTMALQVNSPKRIFFSFSS